MCIRDRKGTIYIVISFNSLPVLISSLKGHRQLWDRADLDTGVLTLKRIHLNLESKFIEISQCFAWFSIVYWKPVFECPFAYPMILILSYLVKNSICRVSVICKLAMKWYPMRMCANWLCSIKSIASSRWVQDILREILTFTPSLMINTLLLVWYLL